MHKDTRPYNEKLVEAYNIMMLRVSESLTKATHGTGPKLRHAIAAAEEKAVELGELTREEALKVGEYLRRDIQDAGKYLAEPEGEELADWLRFDIQLIETELFDKLLSVADQAKLDMLDFEEQLAEATQYRSGEITGPGTLVCDECSEVLHFHKTTHIPPCPKCHGSSFSRS
jgi:Zinc-ribbon containing domain